MKTMRQKKPGNLGGWVIEMRSEFEIMVERLINALNFKMIY